MPQSQLLTHFFASVHEFNSCKNWADYENLAKYYDAGAELSEVDPPNKKRTGRNNIIKYLVETQPRLLPRFWPSLPITETADSDTLTAASLEGSATYFDCTTNPPPKGVRTLPFTIRFRFEFTRPDTASPWVVTIGKRIG
jgi:hypothetical protein